jgi:hypothetical protein
LLSLRPKPLEMRVRTTWTAPGSGQTQITLIEPVSLTFMHLGPTELNKVILDTSCTRTGRPRGRPDVSGPTGEGLGRTARMHVSEESDSGIVPMNHSNKGGQPPAESEEGRPLVKENTHPSHTRPTQSGVRVPQGLMGVRSAENRCTATHPRQEPYALASARTDLCGGQRVTAVPTATATPLRTLFCHSRRQSRLVIPAISISTSRAPAERDSTPPFAAAIVV